ncbi:MAG: M28 family peptidase, partial [Armatimonadota bacterium]|nr:M28 family peptidase [Armatimonadota bacterium]
TPRQGKELRQALEAGRRVRLHAVVHTRHYDGVLPVISGRLPGTTEEEVVLTGHFDEFGADDNCSQVAVALEAVRALKTLLASGALAPLQRGVRLLFPMEVRGLNALVQDPEETRRIRVGLNIDTVGTDQNAVTTECTLGETFLACPSCVDDFAAELLDRIRTENPLFRWRFSPAEVIDNILGEPLVGAPTPAIWHASATHHLALDTPERLSPRMLRHMACLAATYAGFLANAGAREAIWLAEVSADRGARRMAEAAAVALRATSDDDLLELVRQVRSLHQRYDQKVLSAAWFTGRTDVAAAPHAFHQRAASLRHALRAGCQQAEHRIARHARALVLHPFPPHQTEVASAALAPTKAFRGFLAFEDLSDEERDTLQRELGIAPAWGAPMWVQNALFLADGRRTLGEIAALLHLHSGVRIAPDTLQHLFRFLQARGKALLHPPSPPAPSDKTPPQRS